MDEKIMNENIWRLAQFIMWAIGIQTGVIITTLGFLWAHMNKKFDTIENRVNRIESDMIEVKTILKFKECCMIKDERHIKKAE